MKVLRRYVSDTDFREALDKAPPGIIWYPPRVRADFRDIVLRPMSSSSLTAIHDLLFGRGWHATDWRWSGSAI